MQVIKKRVLASSLFTLCSLLCLMFFALPGNASMLTPSSPANPLSCEPVTWVNAVNVTISGNTIQKTGGAAATWDAGAVSSRAIRSGDGYVQVTVDALNPYRMVGLSNGDS